MIGFRLYSRAAGRFSGQGFIAGEAPGLVTVAGAPATRRITVTDKISGVLVAASSSAPDGTYRIDNLNPARKYYVTAFDHTLQFNAVIRDNIAPVNE